MKIRYGKLAATFGALLLALVCAPSSWAGCAPGLAGPTHSSWLVQPGHAMLLQAALDDDHDREPSIVGFWHFKFFIGGQEADAGNQQWHSDGTEILNSGLRPPIIGDFCLGVWQQVGPRSLSAEPSRTRAGMTPELLFRRPMSSCSMCI